MGRGIRYLIRGAAIIFLLAVAAYLGTCAYANFFMDEGEVKLPDVEDAAYAVQIKSTGQIILSNNVEDNGSIIICHGYWEHIDNKYLYRQGNLTLNEKTFGSITVTRRK